jgi:hypothetical protein
MAYAESEFPHTNYHDSDLRELIELYKKLVDEYQGTLNTITEVNNRLNKYESNVPHYVRFLMDEEIQKYITACKNEKLQLEAQIKMLENDINDVRSKLEREVRSLIADDNALADEIKEYRKEFLNTLEVYDRKFSEMRLMILASSSKDRQMLEKAIADMKKTVADIPKSELPVFNPIKVENDTINGAINDIYNIAINRLGFTAIAWHKAHITAQYFKDSNISAMTYWMYGSIELGVHNMMFSPVSGRYTTVKMAVYELADFLKVGDFSKLTASEFDALNLTAKNYDDKNVKAQSYDWHGKELTNV